MVGPNKQDLRMVKNQHTWRNWRNLGVILENKVVQKLMQENNAFTKSWSHKLILFNERKKQIDIWLWNYNHGNSWLAVIHWQIYFLIFLFEYVDSWSKILLFRTHYLWNSTTEVILNCTSLDAVQTWIDFSQGFRILSECKIMSDGFCIF